MLQLPCQWWVSDQVISIRKIQTWFCINILITVPLSLCVSLSFGNQNLLCVLQWKGMWTISKLSWQLFPREQYWFVGDVTSCSRKPLKPGVASFSPQSPRVACGQGELSLCSLKQWRRNAFLGLCVCAGQRKAGQVPGVSASLMQWGFTVPRTLALVLSLAWLVVEA